MISRIISSLAIRGVAASTQNQALSAALFLYQEVPGVPIDTLSSIVRAQRPLRLPVVLTFVGHSRTTSRHGGGFTRRFWRSGEAAWHCLDG